CRLTDLLRRCGRRCPACAHGSVPVGHLRQKRRGLCKVVLPRPAAERLRLSVINSAPSILIATAPEFLHVSMYAAAVLHSSRTSDQVLSLCVRKGAHPP